MQTDKIRDCPYVKCSQEQTCDKARVHRATDYLEDNFCRRYLYVTRNSSIKTRLAKIVTDR